MRKKQQDLFNHLIYLYQERLYQDFRSDVQALDNPFKVVKFVKAWLEHEQIKSRTSEQNYKPKTAKNIINVIHKYSKKKGLK